MMTGGLGVAANGKKKCTYSNTTCMLVMKEELYMYIQPHAYIVGTYLATAPVPMQVHWTTLVQVKAHCDFALAPKHLAEH